jgi:predicted Zn finger-like uncharacterized protein
MKIACQSCGAKYSIADDKVQGKKVFKIKCKKCSADIIVRGDQAAPGDTPSADVSAGVNAVGADQFPEDEATRVVSGGENDAVWHAAIDDNNTGPFSVTQLKQYAASGQVNGETSVWKDGFADWKPLKDVPELAVQVLSAGGMAAAPAASGGGDALFGGGGAPSTPAPSAGGGGGLFGGESKPAAKAAARTAAKASSGNDLFGGGKSSMFGDEAVETSAAAAAPAPAMSAASSSSSDAASPKLDAASMTGQRNENSVLFSLATLQQVAGSAPAKTETKKDADASGLIDIKSMAGTMGPGGGANKSAVDEILSVGAGGGLASPLAAPVLAPVPAPTVAAAPEARQKGSNTTVIASVLGASIILVGGGLGAVFLLKSGQQQTQVGSENNNNQGNNNQGNNNQGNNNQGGANNAGVAGGANNGTAGGQPAGTGAPPTGTGAPPTGTGAPSTGPAGTAPSTGRGERPSRTPRNPSGTSANTPAPTGANTPPPAGTSSPAPSGGTTCAQRCRGDIACLLSCGTRPSGPSGPSGSTPAPSSGGNVPEAPQRSDVGSAMRGVQPAVRACASGQPGPAMITVVFASSGRVTTATVAAPFAGTPAGSCMARAVRAASVPPFSRPTFQVQYPFAL